MNAANSNNSINSNRNPLQASTAVPNLPFLMNALNPNTNMNLHGGGGHGHISSSSSSNNRPPMNFQQLYPNMNHSQLATVAAAASAFSIPMFTAAAAQAQQNLQAVAYAQQGGGAGQTLPNAHTHAHGGGPSSVSSASGTLPMNNPAVSSMNSSSSGKDVPMSATNMNVNVNVGSNSHNPNPNPFIPIAPSAQHKGTQKETIRKSEIEAALKSKPQRGRKRENLSGLERQELTRTRNREHAKTTRIRKKARYEELVACEKKYLDLLKTQEFEAARKGSILNFLAARSDLLKSKPTNCNDSQEWNFSFEHESSSYKSEDVHTEPSLAAAYNNIVMDSSSFTVDIISGLSRLTAANLASLQAHDNHTVNQIKQKVGGESNFIFEFKVKGARGGIAVSNNDDGFAECEFSISSDVSSGSDNKEEKQLSLKLKTDFLQFKFAKDSNKIISIKIFNVSDATPSFNVAQLQNLGFGHGNFPSVVSLEQTCSVTSEKIL